MRIRSVDVEKGGAEDLSVVYLVRWGWVRRPSGAEAAWVAEGLRTEWQLSMQSSGKLSATEGASVAESLRTHWRLVRKPCVGRTDGRTDMSRRRKCLDPSKKPYKKLECSVHLLFMSTSQSGTISKPNQDKPIVTTYSCLAQ